jgi:hypothetical protein
MEDRMMIISAVAAGSCLLIALIAVQKFTPAKQACTVFIIVPHSRVLILIRASNAFATARYAEEENRSRIVAPTVEK